MLEVTTYAITRPSEVSRGSALNCDPAQDSSVLRGGVVHSDGGGDEVGGGVPPKVAKFVLGGDDAGEPGVPGGDHASAARLPLATRRPVRPSRSRGAA